MPRGREETSLASPQTSASLGPCVRKARPIRSMVAIASRGAGTSPAASIMRAGCCARVLSWMEISHGWPPMERLSFGICWYPQRTLPSKTPGLWLACAALVAMTSWLTTSLCQQHHSFSLTELPEEAGPLYHPRLLLVVAWTDTVGNALGIARGAIDAFIELATSRGSSSAPTLLRNRPLVQARLAEAEAILSAARAYVVDAVGTAWDRVLRCGTGPQP